MLPVALLAGGLATRIRPLTERIPKALLEIEGLPFVDYQLALLKSSGIERVVLCLGYLGEMVRDYLGDGSGCGMRLDYVFDGANPLGTGGAVKKALPFLGESFFVLYGDSYLPIDYASIAQAFTDSNSSALMTVFFNDGKWDKSNVVFEPEAVPLGRVVTYDKRLSLNQMRYIDYGLGCLKASVFDTETRESFDLAETYTRLAKEGRLAGFEVSERFYEIGSFDGIRDFSEYIRRSGQQRSTIR